MEYINHTPKPYPTARPPLMWSTNPSVLRSISGYYRKAAMQDRLAMHAKAVLIQAECIASRGIHLRNKNKEAQWPNE